MQQIQKYIIWLIILSLISILLPIIRDIYLSHQYGTSAVPLVDKAEWKFYIYASGIIQNIASALWLSYLAKKHNVNRVIWSFFGISFGLMAVGLFYLVSIHEKQINITSK